MKKFLGAFFLGFIVPGIVFAMVWYFVTGEFIFDKKEGKASPDSQPAETQPLPIEAAEVETELPPKARGTENLSLTEVDPLPAQVAATEEDLPVAERMALSEAAINIAALRIKYTEMQIENERKMEAIEAELDARQAEATMD